MSGGISRERNIGAEVETEFAMPNTDVTAAGSGDNVEVDGSWVDRERRLSGVLSIQWKAVLAEDETLSLTANLQDAVDSAGVGVADYVPNIGEDDVDSNGAAGFDKVIVATGGSGGSTEEGTTEVSVSLGAARQFIRSQVTPDLSAGATDTAEIQAQFVLAGSDQKPI